MTTDDLVLDAKKAALLELVMRQRSSAGIAAQGAPIPKRVAGRVVPLTHAQARLAFLCALHPDSNAFTSHLAFDLQGSFAPGRLESALRRVVARHPPLRGVIDDVAEPARLRLLDPSSFRITHSAVTLAGRHAALRAFADQPLDPRRDWPIRVLVLEHGAQAFTVAFAVLQLAADGESLKLLFDDLTTAYETSAPDVAGSNSQGVDFLDYASFLDDPRRREQQTSHLSFWQTHLAGLDPFELPSDRPRPARSQLRGETLEFAFSAGTTLDIARLCSSQRVTKFMVLASATAFVLSLASGRDDICFGTLVSDRERGPLQSLVGCFMNTVVLRVPVASGATVGDLLASVRDATAAAIDHQGIPFDVLVKSLGAQRSVSATPLISVMFTHSEMPPTPALALEGVTSTPVVLEPRTAQLDLTIETWEDAGVLRGRVRYSTERFEPATAQRIVEQLEDAVALFRDGAAQTLDQIEIRRGRAADLIGPTPKRPSPSLLDQIREHARLRPNGTAVRALNGSSSYAMLAREVSNVSARLRQSGVRIGDRVGLMHSRTLGLLPWILGIWASGGCYVPMDPELPTDRLRRIAADAGISVLVSDAARSARPQTVANLAPVLEALIRSAPRGSDPDLDWAHSDPDRLAYLMFTSGTTGRPKGVEIQHGALNELLGAMGSQPGCGPEDVFLATASISFDMSIPELLLALYAGGCTALAEEGTSRDPRRLAAAVNDHDATLYCATPGAWKLLIEDDWPGRPNLRAIIGGEAVPADVAAALQDRVGALFNMYGPTEATVWTGAIEVDAQLCNRRGNLPIGGPLRGHRWVLLDRYDRRAVVGSPAELHLAGPMLARGYWRDPSRTADAFVPDPEAPNRRLYRTGDQVRSRNDGTLDFLGRRDRQIKLAGFRIEPGEIEVCLRSQPGVTDAAVTLRPGPDERPTLVGFVVVDAPGVVDGLDKALRGQLPASMIPAAINAVEVVPRGTTGKVDVRALPPVRWRSAAADDDPRTPMELRLLPIWRDLLATDAIARTANFFALGGHSLLALRLVRRVEGELRHTVPLASFLASPTIAGLARHIEAPKVDEDASLRNASGGPAMHTEKPLLAIVGFAAGAVALSAQLPDDVDVVHLNPLVGWSADDPDKPACLDELALRFAQQLLAGPGRGPVALIGYCDDAKMATLVGQRIRELGGSVSFLGLIDVTFSTGDPTRGWRRYAHQLRRFGPAFAQHRIQAFVQSARRRARDRLLLLRRRATPLAAKFDPTDQQRLYVRSYYRALESVAPSPSGMSPQLFLSEEWATSYDGRPAYASAADLKVSLIPGFHDRAFEGPGLARLADLVLGHLHRG